MKYKKNKPKLFLFRIFDYFLLVAIFFCTPFLFIFARIGGRYLPRTRQFIKKYGLYPLRNHYYYPLFDDSKLKKPLDKIRNLPGIKFNHKDQLNFLSKLNYQEELLDLKLNENKKEIDNFSLNNGSYRAGDAEFLYSLIRYYKPQKILEIGSGYSTKIAAEALRKNNLEEKKLTKHICIEPYEMPWLEKLSVQVERELIENIDLKFIEDLGENDILFIDSSHIIRPQGDVLKIYLEIIPILKSGVIVHVHDIFSPRDYLDIWVREDIKFWNEQYLLEAFLSNNSKCEIIASLNYLHHYHYKDLKRVCPYLLPELEPGSFYFKIN